ncbi:uncharacterized protein Dyak_GE17423, isoform H [Drosophila yakuba]|uniref:Uncharacterized protein, isoform A n=1 Tax=Drosophila yakuba TaxID=7245 RepID=B4PZZ4_DROYA|nr:uncharacterized protein Dyak_GE17423, isoform A [Drosophila yakuba]KRK06622.1 uncharacterized protein Dyak_GE17423, isoform B [Drosophila yakuba]KRK06623.1 uncharacterized protein Dyak_GE17423, isoform C [Drosophila yakuba]KRK06624.1 uncharacterized protein Dyak_GE17423, isoform D [Drosophila yakuba]KRK06625.1 uncharacterized protein Dyak_GE17423, isoform E [Drosophila yakuba]
MSHCYMMKFVGARSWDTPSYGLKLNMFEKNNSMSSVTTVRQDVAIPLWHLVLLQHPRKRSAASATRAELPRTLYNGTTKTCDFWKYIRHVSAWNNVAKLILSKGASNMSLGCPLKTGVYVMNRIQVPPETTILKFMYHPNTLYTLEGTVYSLNPKDKVTKKALCYYEINATIFKSC